MEKEKSLGNSTKKISPTFGEYAELFCLHGFLGSSKDWSAVYPQTWRSSFEVDLFKTPVEDTLGSLGRWVNKQALSRKRSQIFVGYSLGARIGLSALTQAPQAWRAAVLISGHPGLKTDEEKTQRIQSDQLWAQRFLHENWQSVLSDWNSQGVFLTEESHPKRLEETFSRESLAKILVGCSLGKQQNFREDLKSFNLPILWLVGAKDTKFVALAEELRGTNPKLNVEVVPGAGHRLIFEKPDLVREISQEFLKTNSILLQNTCNSHLVQL